MRDDDELTPLQALILLLLSEDEKTAEEVAREIGDHVTAATHLVRPKRGQ